MEKLFSFCDKDITKDAKTVSPLQQRLLEGLALIPDWIPLCLIGDKKAPLGNDWPNRPYTKDEVREAIINGATIQAKGKTYRVHPKGYGVITGRPVVINGETLYLMAVDQDGSSAKELIQKLSNGEGLSETYAFTSDRPGRCQFLFTVSPEYAAHLRTVKLKTGVKGDDGKDEQLELRWSNLQSVLPPSVHPETGCYRWRRSPQEVALAPAPMWVIEAMLVEPEPTHHEPEQHPSSYSAKLLKGEEWSDEEWALSYLSALSPYRADDYGDWLAVGMALHSLGDSLLTEWDNWSRQSQKYTPGCCEKKWKSFKRQGVAIGTLGHMAKQDGWRSGQNILPSPRKPISSKPSDEPKQNIVERFKADLLAIANSDDDLERLVRINELASTYRMPASEIRKALSKTEVATRTPKAQFFKLDEFLSMETEGIDYLIPGLLPRGETVLCVGLPKSGKTLLTIDAAFAVATGESKFLGETVQQGKVLVVSVDESAQSTRLKLIKRGFRSSDAENLAVMTQWDVSQMGELEAKLEDFRPNLVVIDSVKRITAGREISENSPEFADFIYQLKELFGRYGASCILIHHSNKSQDAVGVGKIRGSTAIAGACWGVWQLDHIIQTTDENGKPIKGKPKFDPSDPRRIFTAICRDADSQTLTIQFNPENHSYSLTSEGGEVQQERKTQEALILQLLEAHHPNGLTGREIMESLGAGRGIYTVLDRMLGRKTVTQRQSKTDRRRMVYALPKKRDTHPPLPCVQMLTNFSESTVVKPKTNTQQIVNNESTFSQRTFDKKEVVDYSIPEQVDISGDSQQILATGGGVCVEHPSVTELNSAQLSHSTHADPTPSPQSPITDEHSRLAQAEATVGEEVSLVAIAPTPVAPTDDKCVTGEEVLQPIEFTFEEEVEALVPVLADEAIGLDKKELATIRGLYSAEVLNAACKRLSPERHTQIKQWVVELNADATAPDTTETQQSIRPNQRVRVHCQGSKRDRKTGTVRTVSGEYAVIWLDDESLPYHLRGLECLISWLTALN